MSTKADAAVATLEINVVTSKDEGLKAAPITKIGEAPLSALSDSLSKDNKGDVNGDATEATDENNVATSNNEGLNATLIVSANVEGVGSLSWTFTEEKKDDVKAEGVGSPSDLVTSNRPVKNCVNY